MRVFQFDSFYSTYLDGFYREISDLGRLTYKDLSQRLLDDRFNATHILEPVLRHDKEAFYAVCSDPVSQGKWAAEHGLRSDDLHEVLLAQIEDHKTEVLYGMDFGYMGGHFMKRLPGCVRKTVCYHAGPWSAFDFHGFDLCLSNYPVYVDRWKKEGVSAAHFSPAHDPVMTEYALNDNRPIDIAFVGSCSCYHQRRLSVLSVIASLSQRYRLHFGLNHPRHRPLVNIRLIRRIPSPFPYLPKPLREVEKPPVFGRRLYEVIGKSKILLNVATDISGDYRVNMRCFEAMGCGACMLSDDGIYPHKMVSGENLLTYADSDDALIKIEALLREPEKTRTYGREAAKMIASHYSKSRQWEHFQKLVAAH